MRIAEPLLRSHGCSAVVAVGAARLRTWRGRWRSRSVPLPRFRVRPLVGHERANDLNAKRSRSSIRARRIRSNLLSASERCFLRRWFAVVRRPAQTTARTQNDQHSAKTIHGSASNDVARPYCLTSCESRGRFIPKSEAARVMLPLVSPSARAMQSRSI